MFSLCIFLAGALFLYVGGEFLVCHASRLAQICHLSPFLIGLLLVSFCTSLPELIVSMMALVGEESSDLSLGNILGSNTANIGCVLALSALFSPVVWKDKKAVRREMGLFLMALFLLLFNMRGGVIERKNGGVLLLGMGGYLCYQLYCERRRRTQLYRERKSSSQTLSMQGKWKRGCFSLCAVLFSISLLLVGGKLLVQKSIEIARILGVSERVIAISAVALGTSLPELATSLVATLRNRGDLLIGNILGSNIWNTLCILGLTAFHTPLHFSSQFISIDLPVLCLFSGMLGCRLFFFSSSSISRFSALIFLLLYFLYLLGSCSIQLL